MAVVGGKKGPSGSGDGKGGKVEHKPLTMKSEKETREERKSDAERTAEFNEQYGVGQKGEGEES